MPLAAALMPPAVVSNGQNAANNFANENAVRSRINAQIPQDAVQEFQGLSNDYSAECGRASGGNNVHCTGCWFFRNQLGGPIKKDTRFSFTNLEAPARSSRPPLSGARTATAAQCILGRMTEVPDRTANSERGFSKLDYRPNERNATSLSLRQLRWISPNGIQSRAVRNDGNGNNANSNIRTRYGRASWTYIPTSTFVNAQNLTGNTTGATRLENVCQRLPTRSSTSLSLPSG